MNLSHVTYYSHCNLLLNFGYLTVEQRKNNGKYAVSLYRLPECVEPPPTTPSPTRQRSRKAIYEKPVHGKNGNTISNLEDESKPGTPMSQKLYSGKLLKTSPPLSQKLSYEKLSYEEMESGNLGHHNINNNSTTNSFFEKKQGKNHQGPPQDDKKPVPLFSLEQAKAIMRYDFWRREVQAWGKLKERLGHFAVSGDKARYERRTTEILDEIARQVRELLNSAQEPEHAAACFAVPSSAGAALSFHVNYVLRLVYRQRTSAGLRGAVRSYVTRGYPANIHT